MNERSEARTISDLEATRPGLIYLSDAAFDRDETMKGYAPALYAYLRGHYSAVYIFRDASFALQRAG